MNVFEVVGVIFSQWKGLNSLVSLEGRTWWHWDQDSYYFVDLFVCFGSEGFQRKLFSKPARELIHLQNVT